MRVTVRFSSQATVVSWLIRLFLWSPWSHVEFVTPTGATLGARLAGGVSVRGPMSYKRYRDIVIEAPDSTMLAAFRNLGAQYDALALLAHLFRISLDQSRKFTCVEFVGAVLRDVGWLKLDSLVRLKPSELYLVCLNREAV